MAGSEQTIRDAFIFLAPGGGKDSKSISASPPNTLPALAKDHESCWRKAACAIDEAANNRGREANALKLVHEFLQAVVVSGSEGAIQIALLDRALEHLHKIKDWDRPQWFKTQPAALKDAAGRLVSEHELVKQKNRISDDLMGRWDAWAQEAAAQFIRPTGEAIEQLRALDEYLVRRVALDSVKNWLRRRPCEQFINDMFEALATNKLYVDTPMLALKALKDEDGQVRGVEWREGVLYFENSDQKVSFKQDERGAFVELPDDSDMIVFEKRLLYGERQIVPVSQPNGRDPNIQWFNGAAVKKGWQKEQRFFAGPEAISIRELYGFFPDHFPMRLTNSQENRQPTEKVGGAIYGYAKEHAGRQARHLIAQFGTVMPSLKRNNSQLINDARQLFGLQRQSSMSTGTL